MDNNFELLKHFFNIDLFIKKEMIKISPANNIFIDTPSINKYTDYISDLLKYEFNELNNISIALFGEQSFEFKKIKKLENKIKNDFYSCGFDLNKLNLFYRNDISNMNIEFINKVKEECVGYLMFQNTDSLDLVTSLNELLHFMHSYIVNNERILNKVPTICEKENYNKQDKITLRGNKSPIFENLFKEFPNDLKVGETTMISINDNKLIMMIRDRGHALTIEITLNNDIARVEYFIPKICNIDMVNSLPGINKVNEQSIGATGVFEIPINELSNSLYNFISEVPTDADIVHKYL